MKRICLGLSLAVTLALAENNATQGGGLTNTEILEFDSLEISGSQLSNEEKVFTHAGAVSSREGINNSTQSLDDIIRETPGAYTQVDPSQGGVSVNIRGMTGLGRVNTMIDGVPQTFFGTSEDRLNSTAHPTPGGMSETGTSAFSTLIDPNFIIGLDINKGTFSGASGNNALMGSANFRTIGIDDIVSEGKNFGLLSKYSYGTNGLGHSYMIAFAQKSYSILNGGYAGAMYAFSGRNISQDYRIGGGGSSTDTSDPNIPPSIIAKNLEQRPQSHLLKFEFAPKDNQKAIFSYRRYETHLAGREISNNNYQLNYNLNPNSSYFDINFLAAYTENMQDFDQDFIWITLPVDKYFDDVKSFNKAFVLDLNNKSIIDLA